MHIEVKDKFYCRTKFTILDAIKFAKSSVYMLYLVDDKDRVKGKLYM
jgi:hypothetical protein